VATSRKKKKAPATPLLTDPVEREDAAVPLLTEVEPSSGRTVSEEQMASVQAELTSLTRDLTERLLHAALRDMEATLFDQVANRLREELPELIDRVLREHLQEDD
jgi:uncharacterized protein (DUF2267 family)